MDSDTLIAQEIFWSALSDVEIARGAGSALAMAGLMLEQAEKDARPLTRQDIAFLRGVVGNGFTSIQALCAMCADKEEEK